MKLCISIFSKITIFLFALFSFSCSYRPSNPKGLHDKIYIRVVNESFAPRFGILLKRKLKEETLHTQEKKLFKDPRNIKIVQEAMFSSTNELYGTSYKSRIDDPKYQFAGKTGTAQVKRISMRERELDLKIEQIPYKDRDHALYVAYGPYINPRYALSIIIEHGGSGSKAAAPIAKKLFKLIIDRHDLRNKQSNFERITV